MSTTQSQIFELSCEASQVRADSHLEFLGSLEGPTWITVPGRDSSRRRVIVCLLHGNEPSGLHAVHTLLKDRVVPETDLGIMIAAVDAAMHEPWLSHRYIPGEKDLNRCFGPGDDNQHQLAQAVLDRIHAFSPEAVVDTHNTSSHSEPFCVSVRQTPEIAGLTSLFTDSLVVIDQQLGTLLEYLDPGIPAVTVEFGGFMDPDADWLARETLHRFVTAHHLHSTNEAAINFLTHPLRLETLGHLKVTYSSSVDEDADLTMINTIDQMNFRLVEAGTSLGWFRQKEHQNLVAMDRFGVDQFPVHFAQQGGLLTAKCAMSIFMATTDPVVANTDCLLYYVPDPDDEY